jgi:hypothetical protein
MFSRYRLKLLSFPQRVCCGFSQSKTLCIFGIYESKPSLVNRNNESTIWGGGLGIEGDMSSMTALREIWIDSSRVDDAILRAPGLLHLSLAGTRSGIHAGGRWEHCMESWPTLPSTSSLTRLDLQHVPTAEATFHALGVIERMPHLAVLSIVFGCVSPPWATCLHLHYLCYV